MGEEYRCEGQGLTVGGIVGGRELELVRHSSSSSCVVEGRMGG